MILLFISGWTSRVYSHLGLAPNFSRAGFLHLKILTAWSLKWQNVGFVHFWWLFAGRRKSWKSKATPKMPTTPPRKECLIKGSLTTIIPYNNPLLVPYFLGGGYPKIPMIIYFKWVCRISVKWPFCMAQLWTVGTVSSLTFLGPEDKSKQWFGWCSESYFLKNTEMHLQHIVWYDSQHFLRCFENLCLWHIAEGNSKENLQKRNTTFPLPETKWCPAIGEKNNSLADGELSPLRHDQQEIRWWNSNLKWMHLDEFLLIATSDDLNDVSLLKVHGF